MKDSFNIALLGKDFVWNGGAELLRVITNALLSIKTEHKTKFFLLIPVKNKIDTITDILGIGYTTLVKIIREKEFSLPKFTPVVDIFFLDFLKNIDGEIEIIEYNETTGLISALRRISADVVMPVGSPFKKTFPFAWVGYIPDLQHKYYPANFNAEEILHRDVCYSNLLRNSSAIIVNSKSVEKDIEKYFPVRVCKIFNLPFSAAPISTWLKDDTRHLLDQYNLPKRYLLISNQFWIHKDHRTAFQALAILVNEFTFVDLHIICTGKMEDYRFPNHIFDLKNEVRRMRIENNVHFLGHLPKIDQIAIMKNSLAVLQPTLFEGGPGGGAVYDAISIGIPAIVSDISVNQEINKEKNIFYFKAGSASSLADTIRDFLNNKLNIPSKDELISLGEQRKHQMGERLFEAARYVYINASKKLF